MENIGEKNNKKFIPFNSFHKKFKGEEQCWETSTKSLQSRTKRKNNIQGNSSSLKQERIIKRTKTKSGKTFRINPEQEKKLISVV